MYGEGTARIGYDSILFCFSLYDDFNFLFLFSRLSLHDGSNLRPTRPVYSNLPLLPSFVYFFCYMYV